MGAIARCQARKPVFTLVIRPDANPLKHLFFFSAKQ